MKNNNKILFFSKKINFKIKKTTKTKKWIQNIIKQEKHTTKHINIILCTDKYLHKINLKYLNHNTLTDIITFNYNENHNKILADIYISINTIKSNAKKYKQTITNELHRIIAHGILHLTGYNDKTTQQKQTMRKKEKQYLTQLHTHNK